ncbi:polysaccharide deacetylase family protein [Legionella jamestowniensis]|uniref:Polysaccharide deacetylase n=1 Tax=Legionella jamestowniensis TaxID=455 RepID=A0A0W0UWG3_9GAMM|nr:polysaccharide deacetylase family protein [Legionella jamestowniensis]KTD12171.1 polysaccharide deacetylase [Legionella jamestowniensis]OCH98644.1 polysaccharide deacetylase [Legionella jamestowniensis]SFL75497.1 Peptidoglycan/xylan/chitin deacetylase, PgdA/CDA1 family [Legionella jamestowniensis DSM 19215]
MRISLIKKQFLFVLFFLTAFSVFAQKKEIAITIDDLPFVGESKNFHLNMIIETLKANEIPATGFVIAKEVTPENWKMLQKFHDAGLGLGNHTYSHLNLNQVKTEAYIHEIDAADKILAPILTEPKYFRYPYLAMSQGDKKDRVLHFLSAKNYQIAPITVDSKDFLFNQILYAVPEKERRGFLKTLKDCYINFIWQQTLKAEEHNRLAHKPDQAQILLIHANLLNAYVLSDIINLYKQNGFTFISLEEALRTSGENPMKGFEENPKQMAKKAKPRIFQSKPHPHPNRKWVNPDNDHGWVNPDKIENYMEWD